MRCPDLISQVFVVQQGQLKCPEGVLIIQGVPIIQGVLNIHGVLIIQGVLTIHGVLIIQGVPDYTGCPDIRMSTYKGSTVHPTACIFPYQVPIIHHINR